MTNTEGAMEITVFGAQGNLVLTQTNVVSGQSISLNSAERRVYLVQVKAATGTYTNRVIKQ